MSTTGLTGTYVNGVYEITTANDVLTASAEGESILLSGTGAVRATGSGSSVVFKFCNITINDLASPFFTHTSTLSYHGGTNNRNAAYANYRLDFENTTILLYTTGGSRRHYFISTLKDSQLIDRNNTRRLFLVTQPNAVLENVYIKGIDYWQPQGAFDRAVNVTIDSCNVGVAYSAFGRIDLYGLKVTNVTNRHINMVGGGGVLNYAFNWNADASVDNTTFGLAVAQAVTTGNYISEGFTWSIKFTDTETGADVSDVLVDYYDDIDDIRTFAGTLTKRATFVSGADGVLEGTYDTATRTTVVSQDFGVLHFVTSRCDESGTTYGPGLTYDLVSSSLRLVVKSYAHEYPAAYSDTSTFTITAERGKRAADGSVEKYEEFTLKPDANITEANKTTVLAYTELETLNNLYDRVKAEWRENDGYPALTRSSTQLDIDDQNLIIDATAASVYAYSGSTLTVKASTYTGGVTSTTGSVTTQNGALLGGGQFDCDIDYQSGAGTTITDVVCSGIVDFNAAGTYTIDGGSINEATNSSGGTVTLVLINGASVTTVTGPSITIQEPRSISVTNIVAGSRIQVYNSTTGSEFANEIVSGTSYSASYTEGVEFSSGDTVRIRLAYQSGVTAKSGEEQTVLATSAGVSALANQQDNALYVEYGVDGSLIGEFAWDGANLEVDVNDTDNVTQIQRVAAWYYYFITTATGISDMFGAIEWESLNQIKIAATKVNLKLDNLKASPLLLQGGRLYRDDGATIIASASNSIQIDYAPVYTADLQASLEVINNGVKKASVWFPHTENLP